MANKVPCGGFTIGDNMQIVDGELSSKVVGGYTSSDVWSGHLYNNTSTDDKQLYDMLVNHVGDTAMVTFTGNLTGEMVTHTGNYKIETKSFGIGFLFEGGALCANANTETVSLIDSPIIEVIKVQVESDVKIPSKYLDIDCFVNNTDSVGITNSYLVLTTNNTRYKIAVDSDGTLKTQEMK